MGRKENDEKKEQKKKWDYMQHFSVADTTSFLS